MIDDKDIEKVDRVMRLQDPWPKRATSAIALVNGLVWIAVAVRSLYANDLAKAAYAGLAVGFTMIFLAVRERY